MGVDFTYTQQEVDALCKAYFEKGVADAIEECRKILLNDCDCKRDRAVEDETDCVNCMAKRMEKLKEKNNGIL